MDPVSLAGLGLGAASIAFQIFDGIRTGYEMFEEAVNMPEDCESLRLSLRLECTRLLDWGDLAGLSDQNNHTDFDRKLKANRATIMALLSEMKTLIDGIRTISLRSDDVLLPGAGAGGAAVHGTATAKQLNLTNKKEALKDTDVMEFCNVLGSSDDQLRPQHKRLLMKGMKRVVDIGRSVADIAKQPGRIRWVLSDKETFKVKVARLKELTDYLHETLGDHQMSILIEQTKETCMAMLQMTSSMGEMMKLVEAIEMATRRSSIELELRPWLPLGDAVVRQATLGNQSTSADTISDLPQTLLAQLTRFRYNIARLEAKQFETGAPPEDGGLEGLELESESLENLKLSHVTAAGVYRVSATYMGKAAWVEWKTYRSVRHGDTPENFHWGPPTTITANLKRLVAILQMDDRPTQFRVPLCVGYFDEKENSRFGLVYRVPEAALQPEDTISLYQLLHIQQGKTVPPLQSRVRLAQEVTTSLYFLHAVKWLHKGLCADSILFPTRGGIPDYSQPYISGFEYSRPDVEGLTSTAAPEGWAVYMHPDYQGYERRRYRKSFDIYSIGIILLEIAWWKPAEEILGFKQPLKWTEGKDADKTASDPVVKKDEPQHKTHRAAQEQEADKEKVERPSAKTTYSKTSLRDLKCIRKRLLTDEPTLLEHVGATMGSRYQNAVTACIGGPEHFKLPTDADETSEIIATLLQQAYLRLVVDKLRGVRV